MAWKFARKPETDALWMRCDNCESLIYKKVVEEKHHVCPECGWHFRLDAHQRIELLADTGTFEERFADLESLDPLDFKAKKSYRDKLKSAVKAANMNDAAVVGTCELAGNPVVMTVIDPTFIMGAMGSVTGEKIARGAELALELKRPYVLVSGSGGGARMEEGVCSLMQMAKSSAAIGRYRAAGGLYLVVLTNATMGGSMASFASLGDIILAEPMALLGFTGPRVIQQTIKKEMPEGFQRSEFLLDHGFVDQIVSRDQLKDKVVYFVEMLSPRFRTRGGNGQASDALTTSAQAIPTTANAGAVEQAMSESPHDTVVRGDKSSGNGSLVKAESEDAPVNGESKDQADSKADREHESVTASTAGVASTSTDEAGS